MKSIILNTILKGFGPDSTKPRKGYSLYTKGLVPGLVHSSVGRVLVELRAQK